MSNLITVSNLSKSFKTSKNKALDNINFEVKAGDFFCVLGPDAAGKTTLLRLLAAVLKQDEGEIKILDKNIPQEIALVQNQISYMPQRFGLYEDLTALENLELNADLRGVFGEERNNSITKLLEKTSLKDFTARLAGNLSGGMKQKLALACTLLAKPKVLLLDEVSVGVDPISRHDLIAIIKDLAEEGSAIVWSTTYLDEAEKYANKMLLINEGKQIFFGAPQDFAQNFSNHKNPPSIENAFLEILHKELPPFSKLALRYGDHYKNEKTVIEAKELTKKFGDFIATNQVNFEIKSGKIFGFLGPNGAGKSTTFKMLCGLLKPTSGTALVSQISLLTSSDEARQKIGYMAQKFSLYGELSVLQNLQFFCGAYNLKGKDAKNAIAEIVDSLDLHDFLNVNSIDLPLGIKQRLALGCCLLHKPEVLFLDEPTSGVDPATRQEFWFHIKALAQKGVTIMVTTHFMDEAEYCDLVAIIYKGEKIAEDNPQKLKDSIKSAKLPNPSFEDVFTELIKRQG